MVSGWDGERPTKDVFLKGGELGARYGDSGFARMTAHFCVIAALYLSSDGALFRVN
jgi:hypothetical protein